MEFFIFRGRVSDSEATKFKFEPGISKKPEILTSAQSFPLSVWGDELFFMLHSGKL